MTLILLVGDYGGGEPANKEVVVTRRRRQRMEEEDCAKLESSGRRNIARMRRRGDNGDDGPVYLHSMNGVVIRARTRCPSLAERYRFQNLSQFAIVYIHR